MQLPTKNTPRWLIFLFDVAVCLISISAAYLLRFEFHPPANEIRLALTYLPIFLSTRILSFILGKTYAGIIRYTSTEDTQRIFLVVLAGSSLFVAFNFIRFYFFDEVYFIPFSIIVIDFLTTLFVMIAVRIGVKVLYLELKSPTKTKENILIYGAGESGVITKRTIERDSRSGIHVQAFIDDDINKAGKKVEGVNIFHTQKARELYSSGKIEKVIISIQNLPPERKQAIINEALEFNIQTLDVPPVKRWIKGELTVRQLREVKIEDLLGRPSIDLDKTHLRDHITGKTVVITGAAGSIGSEISRQVLGYQPKLLVLLDQAETPMYELKNELLSRKEKTNMEFVVGDVRQRDRMKRLLDYAKPELVFHAAAYKHVPLMEENPTEAVLANVLGTKNMVDLSSEAGVEKFVLVSTDKAVNPTSVMGATKRIGEIYAQSKNRECKTQYITTRFGNVLGSNGSVIPLFKRQIEEGGPLTVTHEDVTRYFMTIPEATQLVLEASAMGDGGEIFVFDMGESVKIHDLAQKMIQLSGLELGKDIEIKITGLRPGEKLYEELLSQKENTIPTHHEKILKAQVRSYEFAQVEEDVEELIALFRNQNNRDLVAKMKKLVPEYISQNSEFSSLDQ